MQTISIDLKKDQKLYFASDFHLGAPSQESSRLREKKIIRWLNAIEKDVAALFLVGDLFDFWFEYTHVVPKGYVRFLSKLADLSEKGIPIYIFHGNHDMWMFDYLQQEIGVTIFSDPITLKVNQTTMMVGHGDGLGPGDNTYKVIRKIFRNNLAQWLFHWIHPDIGYGLAIKWSSRSRLSKKHQTEEELKGDNEWLLQYSKEIEKNEHHDFYVFGHRHLPMELPVNEKSTYINLGEWINYDTFGEFNGTSFELNYFEK
jgi:UDP-2,3-diacylglucosamine hydrolase